MLIPHTSLLVLQDAVHEELFASNLYKHLANQCLRVGLFGASKFFANDSKEELEHYDKLAAYINDRGSVAEIPAIEAITEPVLTLEAALNMAYNAEVKLGGLYQQWYSAIHGSDPTTAGFLLEFLSIQSRSIGELADWKSRLTMAANDPAAILMIDSELGQ